MILALNTAQKQHELALIDGDNILASQIWTGSRDDVETLVPRLTTMLEELGLDRTEIKNIVVVNGPGPYTAVRVGVSFANALAEGLKANLYSISTLDLMIKKAATTEKTLAILFAGGMDVAVYNGETKIGGIAELLADHPHNDTLIVSEVNDTQAKELHSICLEKNWTEATQLQSLAEVILTEGLEIFQPTGMAEAKYLRSPKITKSTNPWKKP